MAIQTVNVGTTPNDGTGDPARTAFTKLNGNFTAAENAASKLVATNAQALAGTAGVLPDAAGVHAAFKQFGLGSTKFIESVDLNNKSNFQKFGAWYTSLAVTNGWANGMFVTIGGNANRYAQLGFTEGSDVFRIRSGLDITSGGSWKTVLHSGNTTVDGNGFIKAASPIANLYHDRAESNGSAELEAMQFERIGTGHYRLTGVPGLSRDGWYIETPKDRNNNIYFTIDYDESVEGELTIRTYTPDYSTGRAENGAPVDIIDGRFVSLRFAESTETTPPEE